MKCHQQKNQQTAFGFWILLEEKLEFLVPERQGLQDWRRRRTSKARFSFLDYTRRKNLMAQ